MIFITRSWRGRIIVAVTEMFLHRIHLFPAGGPRWKGPDGDNEVKDVTGDFSVEVVIVHFTVEASRWQHLDSCVVRLQSISKQTTSLFSTTFMLSSAIRGMSPVSVCGTWASAEHGLPFPRRWQSGLLPSDSAWVRSERDLLCPLSVPRALQAQSCSSGLWEGFLGLRKSGPDREGMVLPEAHMAGMLGPCEAIYSSCLGEVGLGKLVSNRLKAGLALASWPQVRRCGENLCSKQRRFHCASCGIPWVFQDPTRN
jgi:hypothetical protein